MRLRLALQTLASILLLSSCSAPTANQKLGLESVKKPVEVSAVRPDEKTIYRRIEIPGTIEALWKTKVFAKVSGYLQSIAVDHGDSVKKGQLIATLSSPEMENELAGAQDDYRKEKAEVDRYRAQVTRAQRETDALNAENYLAGVTLNRWKQLDQRLPGIVAQQQIDTLGSEQQAKLARTKASLSSVDSANADLVAAQRRADSYLENVGRLQKLANYLQLRAPFDGVVTQRFVDPGALIQTGANSSTQAMPIVELQDPSVLRIYINVPEPDVPHVTVGREATVKVDALPDKQFTGKVVRFSYAEDPSTRTMLVEVRIDNKSGELRPGMFAHVSLELERHENVLTVPSQALIPDKKGAFLFIASGQKAKKVRPEIGADDGINTEIRSGLARADLVLLPGQNPVSDGDPIKMAVRGVQPGTTN